jgi:hypothetical protein
VLRGFDVRARVWVLAQADHERELSMLFAEWESERTGGGCGERGGATLHHPRPRRGVLFMNGRPRARV